ncbi:unnamed protein product [Paramecium octaurelia]|uniref:Uncharacterized protein n=1 Tax=Paramecium octaurelia TaxID=43137 RepID=A0A8S1WD35_PAROT|nr:unnamed protein product [Paramecium octaurelia]
MPTKHLIFRFHSHTDKKSFAITRFLFIQLFLMNQTNNLFRPKPMPELIFIITRRGFEDFQIYNGTVVDSMILTREIRKSESKRLQTYCQLLHRSMRFYIQILMKQPLLRLQLYQSNNFTIKNNQLQRLFQILKNILTSLIRLLMESYQICK